MKTVTLIRDSEKFILPHFQMYQGLKNYGLMVEEIIGGAVGHKSPDKSEQMIKQRFPDIEIKKLPGRWEWGSPIFNEMIKFAEDDKVIMLHADVVLDKENFKKLTDFVESTDYDIYKVDMKKCWINYYGDLDHGLRDCLDCEPVAVKGTTRFRNFYDRLIGEKEVVIDFITGYHFTGFKGKFVGDWNKSAEAEELAQIYGGWIKAPQEIKDMFHAYSH